MKTILIVGDSMKQFRDKILDLGYEYVQLRDVNKCKNPEKSLKRRVVCDFSNDETINEALSRLTSKYMVDGVLTTYENYVLTAAKIAEKLGLHGIPTDAAQACTDKKTMRELFAQAPRKISPKFAEVTSEADITTFMEGVQFPVILKPANLAKSLLVFKNNSPEELQANYAKMQSSIEGVYKKYAPGQKPKVIIEEFMQGPVHSVDAFVDADGTPHVLQNVVDYQTGYDIGYDDNFHYSRLLPSKLSQAQIDDVREVAALGCKALGMKNSPAHIEIIITEQGPMIVEIGARNGGYRERMHDLANGIDITKNSIALCLGEPLDVSPKKNEGCAVLELFPKYNGLFQGVHNEEELRKLPSLTYYSLKRTVGDHVGKAADGHKMCAIIVLHNQNLDTFQRDLAFVNQNVYVMTS